MIAEQMPKVYLALVRIVLRTIFASRMGCDLAFIDDAKQVTIKCPGMRKEFWPSSAAL